MENWYPVIRLIEIIFFIQCGLFIISFAWFRGELDRLMCVDVHHRGLVGFLLVLFFFWTPLGVLIGFVISLFSVLDSLYHKAHVSVFAAGGVILTLILKVLIPNIEVYIFGLI